MERDQTNQRGKKFLLAGGIGICEAARRSITGNVALPV
jgi:hypothetical protein